MMLTGDTLLSQVFLVILQAVNSLLKTFCVERQFVFLTSVESVCGVYMLVHA